MFVSPDAIFIRRKHINPLARQLRARNVKVLLGGPQISYHDPKVAEQTLEKLYPHADFFIRGRGEQAVVDLAKGVHARGLHVANTTDVGAHATAPLAKLIQTNIPSLKAAADAHIADARGQRRRLGDAPLNPVQMIKEVQSVLLSPAHSFSEALTPAIDEFRENVHATGDRVTLEWVTKNYKHDAFKPPFFQSPATFDRCMAEIVEWWKEPALQLALSVQVALADALDPLAYEAVGVSSCLTDALKTAWKEASTAILEALSVAVTAELKREVAFGTTNHYLSDKYAEEQILPNDVIDKLLDSIFLGCHRKNCDKDELKEELQAARDGIIRADKQASVREHAIKHVFRAVHATWCVEKKTVTDNVLKVVRDTVVNAREQWVTHSLLTDAAIVGAAVEDKDVAEAERRLCRSVHFF